MKQENYSDLIRFLRLNCYNEVNPIGKCGDFYVYGDIIQAWPVNSEASIKLSFLGEKPENEIPDIWSNILNTDFGNVHLHDYIVHPFHGIGIYEGIVTQRNVNKELKHYISLVYANNDRLLFPHDRLKELMPYYGKKSPRLTRLYSKSWQKTKEKVQKDLIGIARELIKVYSAREKLHRDKYKKDQEWVDIVAKGLGFELTVDQETAWNDLIIDLCEKDEPMDRLVCGDVGFGKTELAIRTAALALANGKQVMLIAPTTVLAEQHYTIFQQRLTELPVRVAHLSRLNKGDATQIIQDLNDSKIDLIIGTHRLLGKDVKAPNLGLLVVDEEQKFGVEQKEKIKRLKPQVDVLALSATPIPRSLYMSLSALRGLSVLKVAPQGRKNIDTTVEKYSVAHIKQALKRELDRGGQVYFVHNRVMSLGYYYHEIEKWLKEIGYEKARVEMAHGQMDELKLASVMTDFLKGDIDVLLASSIVENGLDCPKANSLIVIHAERFGLADLYQLRGRVGRRLEQAYAYFYLGGFEVEGDLEITQNARKRLEVIQEYQELGSGWTVALRDLEIRGGGNLLGHEQHGNLEAIGLLLYSQLLQEEIGKQAKKFGLKLFGN